MCIYIYIYIYVYVIRRLKVNENSYSRSRVVTCGRTDRRTDMTKLIGVFSNFVIVPRNDTSYIRYYTSTLLQLNIK